MFFKKRKVAQAQDRESPDVTIVRTTKDPDLRAFANQQLGGGSELAHVENALRSLRLDAHLTEEEVILAAAATKREAFSVGPGMAISIAALLVSSVALFATAWNSWASLSDSQATSLLGPIAVGGAGLFILVAVTVWFCFRTLRGLGSPAAVQAVVTDRRSRGDLRLLGD